MLTPERVPVFQREPFGVAEHRRGPLPGGLAVVGWFLCCEASPGPWGGAWPWRRCLARVPACCRAADGELGLEAVEDGLQAELEAVLGCCVVAGGGGFEAGAQPGELRCDLPGAGYGVAHPLPGVTAVAAELAGERGCGGRAEGVAEHVG